MNQITVNGPNGVTVNFPEGTDAATIENVMSQAVGNAAAPAATEPAASSAPQPQKPRINPFGAGVSQGLTANFGDELFAGLRTPIEMAIGAYKGTDGGGIGERVSAAYNRALQQERDLIKGAEAESPVATMAGNIAGGLVSAGQLAKGGATLLKGAPTTRGLVAQGAGEGALYGAAYGAGAGEGADDRINKAVTGGLLGGAVGGALGAVGGRQATRAANAAVPEAAAIKDASRAAYSRSEAAGVIVKPEPIKQFGQAVQKELADFGYLPALQPKVGTVLAEIERVGGDNVTLKGIDQMRKLAGTLRVDQDASTRALGGKIVEKLDDMVSNLKLTDVVTGNKTAGVQAIQEARSLHQTARKTEMIEEIMEKAANNAAASGSGGNIDNAIRQGFKSILNNPKTRRSFSPDELRAMQTVVAGKPTQNALRLIGKLSPQGNGLMAALGIGATAANPMLALAPAAGYAAKSIADRATPANVEALSLLVRSGGNMPKPALTDPQLAFYRSLLQMGSANTAPAPARNGTPQ